MAEREGRGVYTGSRACGYLVLLVDSAGARCVSLPRPFTTSRISLFLVLFSSSSGHDGAEHEAHFQPEQSAPQASPRFPCAHGHQGRSSRPEPSSREGPQASRGLTVPTTPARSLARAASRFARASRLTDKPQFDAVHRARSAVIRCVVPGDHARQRNGPAPPRPRRSASRPPATAVGRNRIKRLVRESFRQRQHELPAVDVVVNARRGRGKCDQRRDPRKPRGALG